MANRLRKSFQDQQASMVEEHEAGAAVVEEPSVLQEKPQKRKQKETPSQKPGSQQNQANTDEKKSFLKKFLEFYQKPKVRTIWGIFLLCFAIFLLASIISYFFHFKKDFAFLIMPFSEMLKEEIQVHNIMGKTGAFLAHRITYVGYGIFSLLWVGFFTLWSLKRLKLAMIKKSVPSLLSHGIFLMIFGSLTLNMTEKLPTYISGNVGYRIKLALEPLLGYYGLLTLLVFTGLAYGIWFLNLHLLPSAIRNWIKEDNRTDEPVSVEEEDREGLVDQTEPMVDLKSEDEIHPDDIHLELHEILEETGIAKPMGTGVAEHDIKEQVNHKADGMEEISLKNTQEILSPAPQVHDEKNADVKEFEIVNTTEKEEQLVEENTAARLVEELGEFDPTLELSSYKFPNFDLLNDYGPQHGKVNEEEIVANKNRIVSTLKNYGIDIDRITATVGPTVTLYEVVPAPGIRIAKIKNLEDDIALSLAALGIRIIAPIPGKGTVGIEVPNQNPEIVPMRNILASEKFNQCTYELPVALGKTISNEIFIADLAKMPHLLMAGATGQGKSVGLNAILVSLLYKKHPSQLKFVLVDPKKVELTLFNKIERHYLAKLPNSEEAIITDNTKVIHTLNSLCIEMENRYALLQAAAARNIKEYNQKFIQRKLNPNEGHKYLPYIVLVIDEFADLIMTAGKEVETPIARLAQLARAVGIHLIIATQRPSVNIITGVIKANFPARIAFRVTSKIDSRTILDSGGAEQLIGRGDMLLSTGNDLIRIQCAFVDTPEVERITEFIGAQRGYPSAFLLPEYVDENGDVMKDEVVLSARDKMFDEAARLVVQFQQGSASFLQRKLKLGYNRAGRIVDQLEAAGIVGPFEGSKTREVLIKDMQQLEEILKNL
ncbi:MAG: DNA translocase FtsK [Bacteroidia bacterium]|nr:DNA translocase FtsK [Bacteroidia bacterium]